jgi:hypothetical protein
VTTVAESSQKAPICRSNVPSIPVIPKLGYEKGHLGVREKNEFMAKKCHYWAIYLKLQHINLK